MEVVSVGLQCHKCGENFEISRKQAILALNCPKIYCPNCDLSDSVSDPDDKYKPVIINADEPITEYVDMVYTVEIDKIPKEIVRKFDIELLNFLYGYARHGLFEEDFRILSDVSLPYGD